MLSDEEEILIKKLRYCEQEYEQNGYLSVGKFEAIKEAGNLIEKQSKEIESLKEDNKKKSIVIIEYQDLYEKLEDKIKAKTIEIKNRQVKDEFITASQGKLNTIIDMESLLEKE